MKSCCTIILIVLTTLFCKGQTSNQKGWIKGEVNDSSQLVIVKLENRTDCNKGKEIHQSIFLDLEWGMLIFSHPEKAFYALFNNNKNLVFKTSSIEAFLVEIKSIPDSIVVRDFSKCTVPFSFSTLKKHLEQINKLLNEKHCTLEPRIMYCNCCAQTEEFTF